MKPDNILDLHHCYGLVLPNGDFYACDYAEHDRLLSKLHKHGIIPLSVEDPQTFPESDGWLKLTGALWSNRPIWIFDFDRRKITQPQVDAIVDFCTSRARTIINFNFRSYLLKDLLNLIQDGQLDLEQAPKYWRLTES